jgi:hypothetical protein
VTEYGERCLVSVIARRAHLPRGQGAPPNMNNLTENLPQTYLMLIGNMHNCNISETEEKNKKGITPLPIIHGCRNRRLK